MADTGLLELAEQPEEGVVYADKIDPSERRLDLTRPAVELERVVRALAPAIGAYVELADGERLGIGAARVAEQALAPGEVSAGDGRLLVGTGEQALELVEVTPPGSASMAASDYLRGHGVPARLVVQR